MPGRHDGIPLVGAVPYNVERCQDGDEGEEHPAPLGGYSLFVAVEVFDAGSCPDETAEAPSAACCCGVAGGEVCPRKRQGEVETARSECAVETHTAQLFPMPCGKEVPFRGEAVSGSVAADVGGGRILLLPTLYRCFPV